MTVSDLLAALDRWCPFALAMDWDNTGLNVGDPAADVSGGIVALDLTHDVLDEARAAGANVVVTHHPLVFKPLKRVVAGAGVGGLAHRCAREGVSHIALHTNLDVAPGGVSHALAADLGLVDVAVLVPTEGATLKLVTFVPPTHADAVRAALAGAGAGHIGAYLGCAFESAGTGHFRPDEHARPFTGTAPGTDEATNEVRIEVEVARALAPRAVAALRAAHPYEQVVYDLIAAEQPSTTHGLGAIGRLPEPMTGEAFLAHVCRVLGEDALRVSGDAGRTIARVAVCGGSGSDFAGAALRAGADAYVTADVTYHRFFDTLDAHGAPAMLTVDARHDATERVAERLLLDACRALAPAVTWQRTAAPTSPARVFVARTTDG